MMVMASSLSKAKYVELIMLSYSENVSVPINKSILEKYIITYYDFLNNIIQKN
jgi:hypothetical protein